MLAHLFGIQLLIGGQGCLLEIQSLEGWGSVVFPSQWGILHFHLQGEMLPRFTYDAESLFFN